MHYLPSYLCSNESELWLPTHPKVTLAAQIFFSVNILFTFDRR